MDSERRQFLKDAYFLPHLKIIVYNLQPLKNTKSDLRPCSLNKREYKNKAITIFNRNKSRFSRRLSKTWKRVQYVRISRKICNASDEWDFYIDVQNHAHLTPSVPFFSFWLLFCCTQVRISKHPTRPWTVLILTKIYTPHFHRKCWKMSSISKFWLLKVCFYAKQTRY